jgi:hypothetical protein
MGPPARLHGLSPAAEREATFTFAIEREANVTFGASGAI